MANKVQGDSVLRINTEIYFHEPIVVKLEEQKEEKEETQQQNWENVVTKLNSTLPPSNTNSSQSNKTPYHSNISLNDFVMKVQHCLEMLRLEGELESLKFKKNWKMCC